jgi:ABC-type transport system involved in multi-copper enzyme maturation permease subunit
VGVFNRQGVHDLLGLYHTVFFLGGYVFASQVFGELHSPQRSYTYLTLPVSTAEKLVGSWLLVSLGFVVVYWLAAFLIYVLANLVSNWPHDPQQMFNRDFFHSVVAFLVTQTIFFLGACYFRKNNFLKTLFALFVVALVVGLYTGGVAWLVLDKEGGNINFGQDEGYQAGKVIEQIATVFFRYVLGPFMLIVSYFRLKERQA